MKKLEPILWVIAMLKNVTGNVTGAHRKVHNVSKGAA